MSVRPLSKTFRVKNFNHSSQLLVRQSHDLSKMLASFGKLLTDFLIHLPYSRGNISRWLAKVQKGVLDLFPKTN